MKRLLIVGGGGHGRAVAEAAVLAGGFEIAGFLDDKATEVGPWPVLGDTASAREPRPGVDAVIVAIGNNRVREALFVSVLQSAIEPVTIIHPRAIVAPSAQLGRGCAVMAGAVIGTEAILGEGAIVNSGGVVDHHCKMEGFAHVGTNATMAGLAILGRGAWMQAGSALGYEVTVDPWDVLSPGEARENSSRK